MYLFICDIINPSARLGASPQKSSWSRRLMMLSCLAGGLDDNGKISYVYFVVIFLSRGPPAMGRYILYTTTSWQWFLRPRLYQNCTRMCLAGGGSMIIQKSLLGCDFHTQCPCLSQIVIMTNPV